MNLAASLQKTQALFYTDQSEPAAMLENFDVEPSAGV
jgi:hypothetical protein